MEYEGLLCGGLYLNLSKSINLWENHLKWACMQGDLK